MAKRSSQGPELEDPIVTRLGCLAILIVLLLTAALVAWSLNHA